MKTRSILLFAGLAAVAWWVYQKTIANGAGVQNMNRLPPVRMNRPEGGVINCIRPPCDFEPIKDYNTRRDDNPYAGDLGPPVELWQGGVPADGLISSGLPSYGEDSGTNVRTGPTPFLKQPLTWIN